MSIDETGVPGASTRSPEGLGAAVDRVCAGDGRRVGTGFLLAPGTVATCAHAVADALCTDADSPTPPASPVTVEFPLLPGALTYEASVTAWRPVGPDGGGDIALLRLPEGAPGGAVPLAGAADVWHHRFRLLGFPAAAEHGAWIGGRLPGEVGHGWISMKTDGTGHRIGPGCKRWDVDTGERLAPAVEPAGPVWLVTLADDGTLLTRALGDNGLTLWRSEDTKEPYLTLPLTAEPEDLRLRADRLTVHQADSRLAIPLDPGTWHDTLCRRWTAYTPEELRILRDAGAVTDSPCP
ncbi:serine protease [Streptomyces sp. NPDC052687]|uniref:S1 family peptidase n=1 Tax=Streptomyces sp. NPDC052687 TaxID=3154759 RepID=UPI00343B5284